MNSKQKMKLLPMLHILQQVGLMRLKHTRPYASRSLADSYLYQFPKPLQFSLKKFGSMSSVPYTISFKHSKQQFTQVSFFCLHHPILYFRFSFCCSLPKRTVAEHNKCPELVPSSISMASCTFPSLSHTNNHMLLTKAH